MNRLYHHKSRLNQTPFPIRLRLEVWVLLLEVQGASCSGSCSAILSAALTDCVSFGAPSPFLVFFDGFLLFCFTTNFSVGGGLSGSGESSLSSLLSVRVGLDSSPLSSGFGTFFRFLLWTPLRLFCVELCILRLRLNGLHELLCPLRCFLEAWGMGAGGVQGASTRELCTHASREVPSSSLNLFKLSPNSSNNSLWRPKGLSVLVKSNIRQVLPDWGDCSTTIGARAQTHCCATPPPPLTPWVCFLNGIGLPTTPPLSILLRARYSMRFQRSHNALTTSPSLVNRLRWETALHHAAWPPFVKHQHSIGHIWCS